MFIEESKRVLLHCCGDNNFVPICGEEYKSGIYRNLSNQVGNTISVTANNVFFTKTEKFGKIMSCELFNKNYRIEDVNIGNYMHSSVNHLSPSTNSVGLIGNENQNCTGFNYVNAEKESCINGPKITANQETVSTSSGCHRWQTKTQRTRGRPRKIAAESESCQSLTKKLSETKTVTESFGRTRCGRPLKPPKYKTIPWISRKMKMAEKSSVKSGIVSCALNNTVVNEIGNINRNSHSTCNNNLIESNTNSMKTTSKRIRNIPPEYRCGKCNKIYLGKGRMARHLGAYPHHYCNQTSNDNNFHSMGLYEFLVKKIENCSGSDDDKVEKFITEITNLADELRYRRPNFIQNSGNKYFMNSRAVRVIDLPSEGHYGINIKGINTDAVDIPVIDTEFDKITPLSKLDNNLLNLEDTTIDVKPNLTDTLTSQDSFFKSYDQIINRLDTPSIMHYEHATDNAVEAVGLKSHSPPMLDLSMDIFKFDTS